MRTSPWSSPRFALIVGSFVVTWGLVLLAASQQPGYDHLRDSISALASRGAHLGWIGAMAIAAGGVATLAASLLLRRVSRPAGLSLGIAGVALLVLAVMPISCIGGAAGCEMYRGGSVWTSKVHLAAVGVYEIASVTAAAYAALALLRCGARRAATVWVVGAVLSLVLFSATPVELGLMQRAWLLVHSVLLAYVPYLALIGPSGRGMIAPAAESGSRAKRSRAVRPPAMAARAGVAAAMPGAGGARTRRGAG